MIHGIPVCVPVCACSHEHYCRYRKHSRTLRVPSMQGIWRVVINITYVCIWNTDDSLVCACSHEHYCRYANIPRTLLKHVRYIHVFRTFGDNCRTLMNMTAHRKWTYMYKHSKNITETWGYNKRTKHMWKTFIDLESDADTLDLTDAVLCHAGALRTAVVEMLRFCSTLKLCHAGVWRTILVLVLRMVLGIKIWTECAAFAVSLSACNSFLSHTTQKLTNCCQTATHTKPHPFLSEYYLSEPSPPFCFHFILTSTPLTSMVITKLFPGGGAAETYDNDGGTVASWRWGVSYCVVVSWCPPPLQHSLCLMHPPHSCSFSSRQYDSLYDASIGSQDYRSFW